MTEIVLLKEGRTAVGGVMDMKTEELVIIELGCI